MSAIAPPEMLAITRAMYMMGRDVRYPGSVTPEIEENVLELLDPVNQVVAAAAADGVVFYIDPHTGSIVASGLRPLQVNDRTQNAAEHSTHIVGLGVDIYDPHRAFAAWCLTHAHPGGFLEQLGLFMERPQWTPDWVHLQLKSPKSGRRVYVPSTKSPIVAALPGEEQFVV